MAEDRTNVLFLESNQFGYTIFSFLFLMIESKSSLMSDDVMSEKLQIFISGRKLLDLDAFSSTNSFLVVYLIQPHQAKREVLRTKVYPHDLNPNYAETLLIDFTFEIRQKLIFEVFHNSKIPKLIGRVQTTVGEIFGSPSNGLIRPILNDQEKEGGKLIIRCEKIEKGKKGTFLGKIRAEGLPSFAWWWFFGGTSPFFRIFRKRKSDQLLIYESEVLTKTTSPSWKQFKLSEDKLSKNDDNKEIQVRFYHYVQGGNHTLIGQATFRLGGIGDGKKIDIVNVKNEKKGVMMFEKVKRTTKHQFGDFLEHGLQLALTTCIDYTASNGIPTNPGSLHYSTVAKESAYEKGMSEVLNILMDYDYDKLVPCFGFGAQVSHPNFNSKGKIHHCFPLNFNKNNPNIYSKEEIIKTYRKSFDFVKLSGPTKFSEILRQAIDDCNQFKKNEFKSEYMILFILTDGQIHDKAEVIDLLIQCNRLPLSIIIVGLGDGDFGVMHELDDDDCQMVDSRGNRTERDLVQFVEFKKFKNNGVELAREVLFELPRQVEEYFELVGVEPSQMKRRPDDIEQQRRFSKGIADQM